jgi:hypothetical protein
MISVIEFLGSDVAFVAAVAIAAYAFMAIEKGAMHNWGVLPESLFFAYPWLVSIATLVFYGAVLYFLLPFLAGLGFPVIFVLMIGLAFIYCKAFNFRIEYGAAFSLLTVILLGTGI